MPPGCDRYLYLRVTVWPESTYRNMRWWLQRCRRDVLEGSCDGDLHVRTAHQCSVQREFPERLHRHVSAWKPPWGSVWYRPGNRGLQLLASAAALRAGIGSKLLRERGVPGWINLQASRFSHRAYLRMPVTERTG